MIYETPKIDDLEGEIISRINTLHGKLNNSLSTSKRWSGFLRRNLIAKAIQGSNSIEGYNVSFEDAVAIVENEDPDPDVSHRTFMALLGYRTAMTYILRISDDPNVTVNEELIRALHYMMMSYDMTKNPGQWRPGPIYVRREPSGERVYEGPDADQVPELMTEFVRSVEHSDTSIPCLIRAAMAHLNLVMIHPFSDGNGRMGRAIQTLAITRDMVLGQSFCSIEEYLGSRANTERYYEVLSKVGQGRWNPGNDARPWTRFCLQAHLIQAITVDRRMREYSRLWGDLEAEIAKRKLNERTIYALYEAAIGFRVRSSRYRRDADVSAQVASLDLKNLVREGLLIPKGEKRGRIYVASPYILRIREQTREKRSSRIDAFAGQLDIFSS